MVNQQINNQQTNQPPNEPSNQPSNHPSNQSTIHSELLMNLLAYAKLCLHSADDANFRNGFLVFHFPSQLLPHENKETTPKLKIK